MISRYLKFGLIGLWCWQTLSFAPRQLPRRSIISLSAVGKTGGRVIDTDEEFRTTLAEADRPVLVFFTAPWCGPCRLSIPVVKDVLKQFSSQIHVVEVCTDDLPDVASDSNVVSIPTIHMYAKDELMDTIVGCVAKTVLASSVTKVLEETKAIFVASATDEADQ